MSTAQQSIVASFDRILSRLDHFESRLDAILESTLLSISSHSSSPSTSQQQQPNSHQGAKKKRNQRTRQQYKKKAQSQAQRVTTVQEMEQSYGQEVEHLNVHIGVK